MNKIKNIAFYLTKYLTLIISGIVFLIGVLSIFITARLDNTFFHQSENTIYKFSFGIIPLAIAIVTTIAVYLVSEKVLKRINQKILLIAVLAICMILFVFWIYVLKLYPISDQKMIYDMAVDFNKNHNLNNHLVFGQYLYLYPFQIGMVLLVSNIFKVLGENYLYIEYLNAICSVLNMFILYKVSQIIFEKKDQKILIILEALFSLYWMFFNVHFYGNIIGLTFALLAVYAVLVFATKSATECKTENTAEAEGVARNTIGKRYLFLTLSSLCIAIAIIIKTNYAIFLCGILIYLLFDGLMNKQNPFEPIKAILIFVAIYWVVNFAFDTSVKYVCKVDLPEGLPMITYVYMGMSEPVDKAPGWYSDVPKTIHDQNAGNNASIVNSTKGLIRDRLIYFAKNPKSFISYYSQKFASTWLNPTFQTIWCSIPGNRYRLDEEYAHYLGYHEKLLSIVGGDLYKVEEIYFDALEIIIFMFSGISIFSIAHNLTKKGNANIGFFILPLIFLGGLAFHLIWETKAIYVIQYYFILLPFTADGITKLTKLTQSGRPFLTQNCQKGHPSKN